jgi:hypothetical protein
VDRKDRQRSRSTPDQDVVATLISSRDVTLSDTRHFEKVVFNIKPLFSDGLEFEQIRRATLDILTYFRL